MRQFPFFNLVTIWIRSLAAWIPELESRIKNKNKKIK